LQLDLKYYEYDFMYYGFYKYNPYLNRNHNVEYNIKMVTDY